MDIRFNSSGRGWGRDKVGAGLLLPWCKLMKPAGASCFRGIYVCISPVSPSFLIPNPLIQLYPTSNDICGSAPGNSPEADSQERVGLGCWSTCQWSAFEVFEIHRLGSAICRFHRRPTYLPQMPVVSVEGGLGPKPNPQILGASVEGGLGRCRPRN